MTDTETTRDPCDDYLADDMSVISDTTQGTDDVTSPSAWAGLKGLMKSPPRQRECLHSPSSKGDCSPIIPSQNRFQDLSVDGEQDDCMSDNESVMSTSLLTVKEMLSKPRDKTSTAHSVDNKNSVKSLALSKSDKSNLPLSQDKVENVSFADEHVNSSSARTKSLDPSKQDEQRDRKHQRKAPKADYTQVLDEIFGSKGTQTQTGPNIPPVEDSQRKSDFVPSLHSSAESLEINLSEKLNSASASSSQLSDLLLIEKCLKAPPRQAESLADDPEYNSSVVNGDAKRGTFAPPRVITPSTKEVIPLSNLTCCTSQGHQHGIVKAEIDESLQHQILTDTAGCKDPPSTQQLPVSQVALKELPADDKLVSMLTQDLSTNQESVLRQEGQSLQHPASKVSVDDLPSHQEPMSKMTVEDLFANQQQISHLTQVDLSDHQQPVSQPSHVDLSTNRHPVSQPSQINQSAHQQPVSQPSHVDLSTNRHPVSQPSQVNMSAHQLPVSQLTQVDLSAHQQPISQPSQANLPDHQQSVSQPSQVDLSANHPSVSQLTQEELSSQLLDFIVEFTQVPSVSSGMCLSGSSAEKMLESLAEKQTSPYEALLKTENSRKLLHPNQETSSRSIRAANCPNNGPEIGKHSQDKQLLARSKHRKQKPTKFCPPILNQKDVMRGPSESVPPTTHPPCKPVKTDAYQMSSSKSTEGLRTKKSDESMLQANESRDRPKQSSSGIEGDKRLTVSANEKNTLLNLMARYQAMEQALQDRPDKFRALDISIELKEIQGTVARLNEQHKAERGRLSVRVGVKGLSKSSKKQLKKELQELGDRQKHLLQVVQRHKQINARLKQVLAGIGSTRTSCSGRESSKDTQGDINTTPSKLAAEAPTVQEVNDRSGKGPWTGETSSVPRTDQTVIVNISHDVTSAENGSNSFESICQKDNVPKVSQGDESDVARTYNAGETQTGTRTDYDDKKIESDNLSVVTQNHKDGIETQKTDVCDNINLISKSAPTCFEDKSIITATNNEFLAKADVCNAPCSQETENCVRGVPSSGAVENAASQMSGKEDSQQDLFSQGSSEPDVDRKMVEEIIASQVLTQESDCPVLGDIRHVGGGISQRKEERMSTGGAEQRVLKKGEMDEDVMERGVEERMDREVYGRMDREVEGKMDKGVDGRMDKVVEGRMDLLVEGGNDIGLDRKMDRGDEGKMDRGVDGRMDKLVEGRMDIVVEVRKDTRVNRRMDNGVDGRMDRNTDRQSVDMPMDDRSDKKKGYEFCEMNWSSSNSSGPVNQMKRKGGESTAPSFEGQSECEKKKIKISIAEQFVESAEGGKALYKPVTSQSNPDATNTGVMERDTTDQKAQSIGNRNSEKESNQSKIPSDQKGLVLSVQQTCSKEMEGSLVPISMKKDRWLEKTHEIIPENRTANNDSTTVQVYGQSLSNHGNSGTLSSAVGAEGSVAIYRSSSNVSSVPSVQKEVTCLPLQEQGTEKVKDMSLMSPPPHHPVKNITTPPQNLQSENLPGSTVLSPGSTVASSDVFPVSCRELVRRMAEREKQSMKGNVLLQREAPSDYIAIPVGRIEDFSENIQVKDVDNNDTQTPTFVQPQVPSVPKSVATSKMATTSKMADLTTMVENGVLSPGRNVLSVRAKGKVFRASLSAKGHIIGSGGEMFHTPKSWWQAVSGAGTVKKMLAYNMVLYKGKPLSSFVVPRESTEPSGFKDLRPQIESQEKPVGSSFTRPLKTAITSTSLPRQSSGISSTTTAANKIRTKSLTYSVIKSQPTGTAPSKTTSTSTANRQTGISMPVPLSVTPPNRNCVAHRDLVAKGSKETRPLCPSGLMRGLRICTIKLIDDAEIIHCPEIDSTFWMTDFKDIRLSDGLWDSVDSWN